MEEEERTTALVPYLGALEPYGGSQDWSPPEGQVIYIPGLEEEEPVPDWFGGKQAPNGREYTSEERPQGSGMKGAREALKKKLKEEEKLRGLTSKVEKAELKSKLREYRRKYRPDMGKTIQRWLKPRPQTQLRDFYIGRAQPGLYVPKVPAWRPTTEFMPAGEAHRPELGQLRRVGAPGPSVRIKTPFRDVQRFEGLGTAMSRLRQLEEFPAVDRAVYAEIHANGDIDTPSHVRNEVSQLGFSKKEIDTSLKRLREIGLIVPTGNKVGKEHELMVT